MSRQNNSIDTPTLRSDGYNEKTRVASAVKKKLRAGTAVNFSKFVQEKLAWSSHRLRLRHEQAKEFD